MLESGHFKALRQDGVGPTGGAPEEPVVVAEAEAKISPYLPQITPESHQDGQDKGRSPAQIIEALAALDAKEAPAVAAAILSPATMFPQGSPLFTALGKRPGDYAKESLTEQARLFGDWSPTGKYTKEGSAKPIRFSDAPFNAARAPQPPSKTGATVLASAKFDGSSVVASRVAPRTSALLADLSSLQAA